MFMVIGCHYDTHKRVIREKVADEETARKRARALVWVGQADYAGVFENGQPGEDRHVTQFSRDYEGVTRENDPSTLS